MKIKILGPVENRSDGYDVWLESSEEWSTAAVLLGSGPTRIDALAAAQRALGAVLRQITEQVG